MKCVTVSNFFPAHQGGLDIVVGELMARLAREGVSIDWFASSPAPLPDLTPPGLSCHGVSACNWIEDKTGLPLPIWFPLGIWQLARAIQNADLVFINDCLYASSWIAWTLAKISGKKIILLQHIDEIPYRSKFLTTLMKIGYGLSARIILRGSNQIVFCSRKVERYFHAKFPFLKNIIHISNGVDVDLFQPDQRTSLASRPRILFAGRFIERKGLDLIRQLAINLPGCDWIFAGWGVIDPAGWGLKNVNVVGRCERHVMAQLYRDSDLLILPSVGEGFPLVVQEAISCGLPVLVSAETASGDPRAQNFLMVAELTVSGLEQAIRAFLQRRHQELEPALRRRRHDFAVAQWSWHNSVQAYKLSFKNILESGVP